MMMMKPVVARCPRVKPVNRWSGSASLHTSAACAGRSAACTLPVLQIVAILAIACACPISCTGTAWAHGHPASRGPARSASSRPAAGSAAAGAQLQPTPTSSRSASGLHLTKATAEVCEGSFVSPSTDEIVWFSSAPGNLSLADSKTTFLQMSKHCCSRARLLGSSSPRRPGELDVKKIAAAAGEDAHKGCDPGSYSWSVFTLADRVPSAVFFGHVAPLPRSLSLHDEAAVAAFLSDMLTAPQRGDSGTTARLSSQRSAGSQTKSLQAQLDETFRQAKQSLLLIFRATQVGRIWSRASAGSS